MFIHVMVIITHLRKHIQAEYRQLPYKVNHERKRPLSFTGTKVFAQGRALVRSIIRIAPAKVKTKNKVRKDMM